MAGKDSAAGSSILSQQLLLGLAEQLKLPLLQIARRAEQDRTGGQVHLPLIQETAENALQLIDNYILGVRLHLDADQLLSEPVSVASVLYDAGGQLKSLAKNYGVELAIDSGGRHGLVMTHRRGLQAALVSLGAAMIEALSALEIPQLKLHLASHHCRYGIVAGLYTEADQLSAETLRRARGLQGRVRQPLPAFSHSSGAGVFVADAILQAMRLDLKISRHHHLYGLATILQPSSQLQLL